MRMLQKIALPLVGLSFNVYADSSRLRDFLATTQTMQADFTQTITLGKRSQISYGRMEIARPNKFRWEYIQDKQLIISDGQKIYIYDQPLAQVTIKLLGQSIDKSPAAVLAGNNNIQNLYQVSDMPGQRNGLNWVKIEPRKISDNNGFQLVLMGFDKKQKLVVMEFTDSFGNLTNLRFTNFKSSIKLAEKDFRFVVPAGVDVAEQ